MIQSSDDAEFVIDGMIRGEIEVLVRVCAFAKYLDFDGSVRLDNCERVKEGKRIVVLSFGGELYVWIERIEMVGEFL